MTSEMEKEIKKLQEARKSMNGVALGDKPTGTFDTELYSANKLSGYSREVVDEVADDENGSSAGLHPATKRARQVSREELIDGAAGEDFNPFEEHRKLSGRTTIAERESEYQAQRRDRQLSPERTDAFEDKTPARSYKDIMLSQNLDRERDEVLKKIATQDDAKESKKRRRWDDAGAQAAPAPSRFDPPPPQAAPGKFDTTPGRFDSTPGRFDTTPGRFEATPGRFDATPGRFQATPGRFDATPGRFDATPGRFQATPGRFDSTPAANGRFDATPGRFQATPGRFDATPGRFDVTPGRFDATPGRFDSTPGRFQATPGRFDATPGRFDANHGRFDATPGRFDATPGRFDATPGRFDATPGRFDATPGRFDATPGRFDATPGRFDATPSRFGSTPARDSTAKVSKWEATPGREAAAGASGRWDETPLAPVAIKTEDGTKQTSKRSRWDETPVADRGVLDASSAAHYGPGDATPAGLVGAATPTPTSFAAASTSFAAAGPVTPEMAQRLRWEREMHERNRYLLDEELDALFPPTGYKILEPPAGYAPIHTPSRKLQATPTPLGGDPAGGFSIASTPVGNAPEGGLTAAAGSSDPNELPTIKPEDFQYFSKLMEDVDEDNLSADEAKELKIMRLLLKIKNGTPPQRKTALRQITDKAREFGAASLFNQILPLLMSPTLEDQERHLLVKVIDRILYKLDDLVRPFVHKILVVIEPLLIDEDYYARVEGREIISNLAKAAGLATMIATMRPDIDNLDEYVRNTTARAFAVVASALGIPALLPFLKAVCQSRKSWQARHTGIKIVQQIAILMGCAVLPHLRQMVEIIEHGLVDDQQKVRTITSLALAALAEAAYPYGIESFDSVLKPLWKGIRHHRGKGLAAFLKAIGFIIPLMDANYANYYTREVMIIVIREFQSPDEEMKKIVLKVVKQCVATDGVEASYVRAEILPEFFRNFWVRRMALDRRNYKQVVETTVEIANKVGASEVIGRICDDLKDESEPYRRMVMETVEHVVQDLGAADIDERLEEQLIDGILYAFQEQASDDTDAMLSGFGVVVNALGMRTQPYLSQICGTIKWRLNNKSASVRMQAADLIARIAVVMKTCGEEILMGHLGVVLYEYLGEEYPEVLGSILGGLKAIVNVIGMSKMTPPIKDLLPRLTPILKNRHEKVQENCIAEGTPILMSDGTSKPIENVNEGDFVASPCTKQSSNVCTHGMNEVKRKFDNGIKPCVAVTLEDGRELLCTPDHRLLRNDGDWIEAAQLQIDDRVVVAACEAPLTCELSTDDKSWCLELDGLTLSLSSIVERGRLLAFARLTGVLLGRGSLIDSPLGPLASVHLDSQIDVDTVVADIKFLGEIPRVRVLKPKEKTTALSKKYVYRKDSSLSCENENIFDDVAQVGHHSKVDVCYCVRTQSRLGKAFRSLPGIMAGKHNRLQLPKFVIAQDTPLVVVREFLAGLFGADGELVCQRNSEGKGTGTQLRRVALTRSYRLEEKEATMKYMKTLKTALERCRVDVDDACVFASEKSFKNGVGGESHYLARLTVKNSLSFAEEVGMRHCAQKNLQLAAVCAYCRICTQSLFRRKRKAQIEDSQHGASYSFHHPNALLLNGGDQRILFKANGYSSHSNRQSEMRGSHDSGGSIALEGQYEDCKTHDHMSKIGAHTWFKPGSIVTHAARELPTLQLRVIGRRHVGSRRMFDLTVPGNHAFFASSIAVHNCIDLVGRIADRGAEFVAAREWMRICFELLEMLKAHKKAIRRAAVNTFGYIAKAIGPQDVLHTLLNNLKVQERQNRVCTTVAIGIVAETCAPFTVLPALMNEYRVPELNVQNGVLKALSFMFEYIGEMGKDYVYAVTPLLEDALMDRDLVHRQTACAAIKHLALGVAGLGCEDALIHLMNYVWPNIFETSPHVIAAVFEAIESFAVSLGVPVVMSYVLPGLYHPARRVREVYWKMWNTLYIYGADSLNSCYPVLENDGANTYRRTQLEVFV